MPHGQRLPIKFERTTAKPTNLRRSPHLVHRPPVTHATHVSLQLLDRVAAAPNMLNKAANWGVLMAFKQTHCDPNTVQACICQLAAAVQGLTCCTPSKVQSCETRTSNAHHYCHDDCRCLAQLVPWWHKPFNLTGNTCHLMRMLVAQLYQTHT